MNMKYLFFDIDGTLLNSGGAGKQAMLAALEKHLHDGSLLEGYCFAGKTDTQIIQDMVVRSETPGKLVSEMVQRIAQSYVTNLANTLPETPGFRVYPDVRRVLEACRAQPHFDLALLTGNLHQGARLKLEHADLWNYFPWGVFGDISEDRVRLAQAAHKKLIRKYGQIQARDIFIIGDTANDVRCGKAIGATTVALVSDFEPEVRLREQAPDYVLYSFRELCDVWNV